MAVPENFIQVSLLKNIFLAAAKQSDLVSRLRKGDFGQDFASNSPVPISCEDVSSCTNSPEKMNRGSINSEEPSISQATPRISNQALPPHLNVRLVEDYLCQFLLESFLYDDRTELFSHSAETGILRLSETTLEWSDASGEISFDVDFEHPVLVAKSLEQLYESRETRFAFINAIKWKIKSAEQIANFGRSGARPELLEDIEEN